MREEMLAVVQDDLIDIEKFFASLSERTRSHSRRVSAAACRLLELAGAEGMLCDEPLPIPAGQVGRAVLYHDIGMVLVPERLLTKTEELTSAERKVIERHASYGGKLLERFCSSRDYPPEERPLWTLAAEVAGSHHERWDGRGYPFGLVATAVPLVSRATALADSYDAIVLGAPHRMSLPHEYALVEIADNGGAQFDPQLVQVFLKHADEIRAVTENVSAE